MWNSIANLCDFTGGMGIILSNDPGQKNTGNKAEGLIIKYHPTSGEFGDCWDLPPQYMEIYIIIYITIYIIYTIIYITPNLHKLVGGGQRKQI